MPMGAFSIAERKVSSLVFRASNANWLPRAEPSVPASMLSMASSFESNTSAWSAMTLSTPTASPDLNRGAQIIDRTFTLRHASLLTRASDDTSLQRRTLDSLTHNPDRLPFRGMRSPRCALMDELVQRYTIASPSTSYT